MVKKGVYKECPQCKTKFYVWPGSAAIRKYCSVRCHSEAMRKPDGKIELRCQCCGESYTQYVSYLKIRKSKYCSKNCMDEAAKQKTGVLSSNWEGGKTDEKRRIRSSAAWGEWRDAVFERDGYTCQICGSKNDKDNERIIKLHPHHIKTFAEYPELRFDVDNGQTLCSDCHYKLHGQANRGKSHKIKWKQIPRICAGCNEEFMAKTEKHFICSHKCGERVRRKKRRDAKARGELS